MEYFSTKVFYSHWATKHNLTISINTFPKLTVWRFSSQERCVCIVLHIWTHATVRLCSAITVQKSWQTKLRVCGAVVVRLNVTAHISSTQTPATKITDGVFQWQWASVTEQCSMASGFCCKWCGGDLRALLSPIVHLLHPFPCIWTWSHSS